MHCEAGICQTLGLSPEGGGSAEGIYHQEDQRTEGMDTALGRGSWCPEWPPVKGLLAFGGQEERSPQTAAGTTGSQLP